MISKTFAQQLFLTEKNIRDTEQNLEEDNHIAGLIKTQMMSTK